MRSFKKTLFAAALTVLIFSMLAAVIVCPVLLPGSSYNDSGERKELAGSIGCYFIGASFLTNGIDISVADRKLGVGCYSIASPDAYMDARLLLLGKELERNSPEAVFLEVGYDGMTLTPRNQNALGVPAVLCRLESAGEKASYFFSDVSLLNGDYPSVAHVFFRYGVKEWLKTVRGGRDKTERLKGFEKTASADVSLPEDEAPYLKDSEEMNFSFAPENVEALISMISLCKEKNIRVAVIVLPVSSGRLWSISNTDEFCSQMKEICGGADCPFYDFNLRKSVYGLLSDRTSFANEMHLSGEGAELFTEEFCDTLEQLEAGVPYSELFFGSYAEAKEYLCYNNQ